MGMVGGEHSACLRTSLLVQRWRVEEIASRATFRLTAIFKESGDGAATAGRDRAGKGAISAGALVSASATRAAA